MNKIIDILESYSGQVLSDEDGNQLAIETRKAASMDKLKEFEELHKMILPRDLTDLLLFSNGIKIFGTEIYSLEEMEFFEDPMLLTFHGWGNGDFDGVSICQGSHHGEVYFVNHSADNSISMNISFSEWILGAIKEIQQKGVILHSMDYLSRNEEGMYKNIFLKLKIN